MRTKQLLRKCSYSLLLVLFTLICALTFTVKPAKAVAEEETAEENVVNLFTPTATGENYTVSGFSSWETTTGVEDYADSPTGKVLHQTVNSNGVSSGDFWPNLSVNIPYEGDTTDFAGYILWIEYDATMYTNSTFYGLFGTYVNNVHVAGDRAITFINEEGKIDETLTGRAHYHHNNYTVIPEGIVDGVAYTYAYTYSFKGYMVIPKETYTADVTPTADTYFKMSHHNAKNIVMDVKVGSIGFYKNYDAVLQEYGRCNYTFTDNGEVIKAEAVKPGSTVVAPEYKNTYTQDGKVYEFVGWSGYTDGMKITSDMTFEASYKVRYFNTIEGASVRTNTGSSGIRFTAEFDENVYNEVSLDENLEFGMIITKYEYYKDALAQDKDLMTGFSKLSGTKYVLITESSANPLRPVKHVEETKVTYRINGALTNIKYSHMDWKWVGVGVIIRTTENGTEYIYSAHDVEEGTRTLSYVASAALNDPTESFNQTQTDTLKNYVYTMAAKLSGVSEADYKAATDKSAYLNDYKLEISGGIKADYDFNANDGTKEAYLTLNESKELFAAVKNESGATLDVAYSISVGDSSVLDVDGTTVTAIKNGYSSLTTSCEIFGINDTITVYTGSEDAGNRANSRIGSNVNASKAGAATGEIEGKPYYWYQYSTQIDKYGAGSAHIYTSYSDISVYYIDYLLSQGYKYLRISDHSAVLVDLYI